MHDPPTSWWISAASPAPTYPRWTPAAGDVWDTVVVGGGIVGVATAYALGRAGRRVALLEARRIGCGTAGHSTAKFTVQHGTIYSKISSSLGGDAAKTYATANAAALDTAERWIMEEGIECAWGRAPNGLWATTEDGAKQLLEEAVAARAAGVDAVLTRACPPDLACISGVIAALSVANQAQCNVYQLVAGLAAAAARKHGVAIFEEQRVTDVTLGSSPHTVTLESGATMRAGTVVMATHLPIKDLSLHFSFCTPSRSYCLAATLAETVPPAPVPGMWMSVEQPTHSLRHDRGPAGEMVLIASGEPHKLGDADPTAQYAALEKWTRETFPIDRILNRWSAMDYMPPDGRPYMGHLTRASSTVYTATGFGKWGLTNGIAAALLFADMHAAAAGGGSTSHPARRDGPASAWLPLFDATRWELTRSASGLAAESWHTVKHLVGDKVAHALKRGEPDAASLKPGEGGIVHHKGAKLAVYRDEAGAWSACSATCTHLGCDLQFNAADKTFDCPCHGSQFAPDGSVIHGPAVKPLCKVELEW